MLLKGTALYAVDNMLLKLYDLYEKSPKKCRQLEDIISDLKACVTLDNGGLGSRPVRASGSRWVSHKLNAMRRVFSRYGAYTNHLGALSEDSKVNSADGANIKATAVSGPMPNMC